MSSSSTPRFELPDPPTPLPECTGPKLEPFTPSATAKIEFIEELSDPSEDQDGWVWKVKINGMQQPYALKMFSFISFRYFKEIARIGPRPLASPQLYVDYFDGFNCECRAYGRLKEEGREDLAVRAHGYLLLTPEQEAEVTEKGSEFGHPPADFDKELNGGNSWGSYEEHRHLPIRAIVKDLVAPGTGPFELPQVPGLWTDLEELHKLGILVRDIRSPNYMGGKLVDFSLSWTTPHPSIAYMDPGELEEVREHEPRDLYDVILDARAKDGWKTKINMPEQLLKCLSGDGENETDNYGVDPRRYNWQRNTPGTTDASWALQLFGRKPE